MDEAKSPEDLCDDGGPMGTPPNAQTIRIPKIPKMANAGMVANATAPVCIPLTLTVSEAWSILLASNPDADWHVIADLNAVKNRLFDLVHDQEHNE